MNKPAKKLKRQKGQVLIIFLLIVVMALAIVLSVASRTITNIRTTTTSDESNRAYFAAESGIEEALKKAETTTAPPFSITTDISNAHATTTAKEYLPGSSFVIPENLAKDESAQVVLSTNPYGNPEWTGTMFTIYFGKDSNPNQAIEVSLIFYNTSTSEYGIKKWAFDVSKTRGNSFCPASSFSGGTMLHDNYFNTKTFINYAYLFIRQTVMGGITYTDPVLNCSAPHDPQLVSEEKPILLRIRALYNSDFSIPVGVAASIALPSQGTIIESTGNVSSVTRKIVAIRQVPSLPSLFDYVLFTNDDLSK